MSFNIKPLQLFVIQVVCAFGQLLSILYISNHACLNTSSSLTTACAEGVIGLYGAFLLLMIAVPIQGFCVLYFKSHGFSEGFRQSWMLMMATGCLIMIQGFYLLLGF